MLPHAPESERTSGRSCDTATHTRVLLTGGTKQGGLERRRAGGDIRRPCVRGSWWGKCKLKHTGGVLHLNPGWILSRPLRCVCVCVMVGGCALRCVTGAAAVTQTAFFRRIITGRRAAGAGNTPHGPLWRLIVWVWEGEHKRCKWAAD